MTKQNDNRAVIIFICICTLLIMFVLLVTTNIKAGFSCKITEIEYKNITPYGCWNEDISSEYCPLPKTIECSGDIDAPVFLLNWMVKR